MKRTIPFVYRNFKYYLVIEHDLVTILDKAQKTVSVTTLQAFEQSQEPLIKYAFGLYQALVR